ncbi:MAG: nucleotidyltransferase family protein [Phormidesmis sp.]
MNKSIQKHGDRAVYSQHRLQELLKDFLDKRGTDYSLQKLGFFGSYARNQATAKSDVDIVFTTSRPNLMTTSILKQDLEELLGCKVDVIRLQPYLTPTFKARIEQEAIYV